MNGYEYGEPHLVPMMVPQRIHLSATDGVEDTAFSSQYNPMKVRLNALLGVTVPPCFPGSSTTNSLDYTVQCTRARSASNAYLVSLLQRYKSPLTENLCKP